MILHSNVDHHGPRTVDTLKLYMFLGVEHTIVRDHHGPRTVDTLKLLELPFQDGDLPGSPRSSDRGHIEAQGRDQALAAPLGSPRSSDRGHIEAPQHVQ